MKVVYSLEVCRAGTWWEYSVGSNDHAMRADYDKFKFPPGIDAVRFVVSQTEIREHGVSVSSKTVMQKVK